VRHLIILAIALTMSVAPTESFAQGQGCRFVLGFKAIHDLDPADVGDCLDDQASAANGDALQHTTKGLLAWRKADNVAAFTNGYQSWVNGPFGLQRRLNSQRFEWEANPDGLPVAASGMPAPSGAMRAITVRQPQPYDLVDLPVAVSGIGTGFEGTFAARLRDATGKELVRRTIHAGGTGILGNYAVTLAPTVAPATAQGTLEVFEPSQKGDGAELNKVVVPVTFGPALLSPYHGFSQYAVAPGDTLTSLAQQWYGDPNDSGRIAEANRDRLGAAPALIPGQVLRIPQ